jgi:hypothetical protein
MKAYFPVCRNEKIMIISAHLPVKQLSLYLLFKTLNLTGNEKISILFSADF